MNTHNFMIGPIKDGARKDIKPFAIPEDAFQALINAYQFRGRIVRRAGYQLLGRLANNTPVMGLRTQELFTNSLQALIAFDTTEAYLFNTTSETFVPLPSTMPVVWSGTDYDFFYTINYAAAFWATNFNPGFNGFEIAAFTGATATTVMVTTTGANTVAVDDFVYFLTGTAGVGALNNLIFSQVTIAGNPFTVTVTSFPTGVTTYVDGVPPIGTAFVLDSTKQIPGQDGIRYYINGATWVNYNPPIDPINALCGCLLMFAYRGYLVFLNTWEGIPGAINNYGNRARWTQIGTPYYTKPVPNFPNVQTFDPLTARDDLFGRGGANDAPTNEVIVGAAFIRDILVVYFERSTWRLRFVNNSQNPFVWERVNVELGAYGTFSTIPFDKGLMAIGNRGIVISDGNDTIRFDEKIPDDVFSIRQNNNGFDRVYGIRTFKTKLNFWTFPSQTNPMGTYPDMVLVYNYDTKNWSYFDDCFTCFGYYYPTDVGPTWGDLPLPWADYADRGPSTDAGEDGEETIIAGNQQGFVFQLEKNIQNSPSLYISAITGSVISSPLNNLPNQTWINITGVTGVTSIDGVSLNGRNFKIANPTLDFNDFTLTEFESIDGGPANGSTYTNILNPIDFLPILAGSVQINVGSVQFVDSNLDGNLIGSDTSTGTINYETGVVVLNFFTPQVATEVYIRIVSNDPEQQVVPVLLEGAYAGGGLIAKISNIDILTKMFNFFGDDKRARLSKIDFYVATTAQGQFSVDVLGDSSNFVINDPIIINEPTNDNPESNVVLTSPNPYQIGIGTESMFRLYCDAIAQTIQLNIYLSDQQMAVSAINAMDIEINAMMVTMRRGGRII